LGPRKSGIPQEVDIPAPVNTTRCLLCKKQIQIKEADYIKNNAEKGSEYNHQYVATVDTFLIMIASCSICKEKNIYILAYKLSIWVK
jgi:hypothetical protein